MNTHLGDITNLNNSLLELETKLRELDANLVTIMSYCSNFLESTKETKEKALQIAQTSVNAVAFFSEIKQNFKRIGSAGEKIGLAVTLGSLLYAGYQHIRERVELLKYIDDIKNLSIQNFNSINIHLNKLSFILQNISKILENNIIRIIEYLAKAEPEQDKIEQVMNVFHRYVLCYLEFNQRYRVYQAYKETLEQYLQRNNFLKILNKEKAEEVKKYYMNDWKKLITKINNDKNSIGAIYCKILTTESINKSANKNKSIFTILLNLLIIIVILAASYYYTYWLLLGIPIWFVTKRMFRRQKKALNSNDSNISYQNYITDKVARQIYNEVTNTIAKHIGEIDKSYINGDFSKEKLFEVYKYIEERTKKTNSKIINLLKEYLKHMLDFNTKTVKKEVCLEFDSYIIYKIIEWYNNKNSLQLLEEMFKDDEITKLWISEKLGKQSLVTKIAKFFAK